MASQPQPVPAATPARALGERTVWVTGAGRGLGRAVATAAAAAGATVALTARSGAELERVARELDRLGGHALVLPADLDHPGAADEVVARIVGRTDRLDGVVCCAGISPAFVRSERLADQDWEAIITTNLTGTFRCLRAAAAPMLAAGDGSMVTVSSVHARSGTARLAAYAASKAALEGLTRALAVEWADRGVRVNALAPGYFPTALSTPLLDSRHGPGIVERIPMGRTGRPEELAAAAVFLLSPAASYLTGATLAVDGGWTAQ